MYFFGNLDSLKSFKVTDGSATLTEDGYFPSSNIASLIIALFCFSLR